MFSERRVKKKNIVSAKGAQYYHGNLARVGLQLFAPQAFSGSGGVEIACELGALYGKEQFLWL